MMISSSTSSNWETSCRLAPVTTSDNGTPRPSTNRCRLVPFFPPVGRVPANCLLRQWRLDHGPVYALPLPGNALHFIIFGKPGSPKDNKEPCAHPVHKMGVYGAGTSKAFLRQGFPLTAGSQNIHDGLEYPARRYRLSASTCFAFISLIRVTLRRWYKRLDFFPKTIGNFP